MMADKSITCFQELSACLVVLKKVCLPVSATSRRNSSLLWGIASSHPLLGTQTGFHPDLELCKRCFPMVSWKCWQWCSFSSSLLFPRSYLRYSGCQWFLSWFLHLRQMHLQFVSHWELCSLTCEILNVLYLLEFLLSPFFSVFSFSFSFGRVGKVGFMSSSEVCPLVLVVILV